MTLQEVWRVLKDVDLEAIRREARRRVDLLVVSEDGEQARLAARALSGEASRADEAPAHEWLHVVAADRGLPALEAPPVAALVVSPTVELQAATAALRDHLVAHGVPVVTVVVGHASRAAAATRAGEWARVAERTLEAALAAAPAAVLPAVPVEWHLPLAHRFPLFRAAVAADLVDRTAKANAGYAFTTGVAETIPVLAAPLALGDMIVLTKNQLVMCYRIVLAHGRDGDPRALVGEIVGVLGSGLLFRQAARQLVGLIPVIGLIPKVAIAYAGTYAVGRAMTLWAAEGREVSRDAVRRLSKDGFGRGKAVARALVEQARATRAALRRDRTG